MIRIAIVEDDPAYREQLKTYVSNYEKEYEEQFRLSVFTDGLEFIEAFHADYDIVFMDIRMKHLDGMETARKIRLQDHNCIIIFITNLAQYALQGYEVEAMSYILKPIQYFAFSR